MFGLETLFCWVPWIIEWCLSWLPRRARLYVHEGGVKITGAKVTVLKHGTFWFFPRWSECYVDNIKRKVVDLPKQVLTTKDGKRVRVGGVLIYHIRAIDTWIVENEDPESGVQIEAERVIREWVKHHDFQEVQEYDPQKREADDLTRAAQEELGSYFGVWVRQLGFKDFAETDAKDLYHSGEIITNQNSIVAVTEEAEG
jgi:hypothetical protein